MIDDNVMVVKEFGPCFTTFRRVDGQEIAAQDSAMASTTLVRCVK